jgi:hypothetical protein
MKFSSSSVLAVLATLPSALGVTQCLNNDIYSGGDPYNITAEQLEAAQAHLARRDTIWIDLWVHFLVSTPEYGLDGRGLYNQLDYLNSQYSYFGVQFQLKPVSYAINPEWASDIDPAKQEKMRQLHRGDYQALNVYLVEKAGGGVCSLPVGGTGAIDQGTLDGDGCFVPLGSGIHAPDGTITHEGMYTLYPSPPLILANFLGPSRPLVWVGPRL